LLKIILTTMDGQAGTLTLRGRRENASENSHPQNLAGCARENARILSFLAGKLLIASGC
jgi:hypothetical protein